MKRTTKVMTIALAGLLTAGLSISMAGPKGPTLVDIALAANAEGDFAGEFDILIAAIGAADPVIGQILSGNGQHTVFAPNDDAFINLGYDEESITSVPADVLTEILAYHVVRGRRYADSVVDSDQLKTLQGSRLRQEGGVLTDAQGGKATIIYVDVPAANGIIHVIDAVVLP